MAPAKSSNILQNALCFLPKAENDENFAWKPDHGKSCFELPPALKSPKSGHRSGIGQQQQKPVLPQIQEWEGGEVHQQEGQDTPRRSSFSLMLDQIQSVSHRLANSINFFHSGGRRVDPDTEDCKGANEGDVRDIVEPVAVHRRLRRSMSLSVTATLDSDGDGDVRGTLGSPVAVGKERSPLGKVRPDVKLWQVDQVRSPLGSPSPKSSNRFNEAAQRNSVFMVAPVPDPAVDDHHHLPGNPQIKPQENRPLGFLAKSNASEEEPNVLRGSRSTYMSPQSRGRELTVVNSQRASLHQTIVKNNLGWATKSNNCAPTIEDEKANANKNAPHAPPWQLPPSDLHRIKTTKEIPKPREDESGDGQSFDFWRGTSIKPGFGGTDDKGQCPWNPDPIQGSPGFPNHSNTPITTKEDVEAQQKCEGANERVWPFSLHIIVPDREFGRKEEEGVYPSTQGSLSPHRFSDAGERYHTPSSSTDASEIGAGLSGDDVTPGAEYSPLASEQVSPPAPGDAAVTSPTVRSQRKKVRFRADGDNDFPAFDGASRRRDHSGTLQSKLSTTRHHQIRYLEDELMQTRAHVAELELDCEAQKDLKLAFKVHALRTGASLKKLRDFALENGLDPRGVDPSFVTPSAQPQELVRQASATEYETNQINSSKKLTFLKAEAKQFGWLCDPKEVVLQEYIGSGSSAEIFKAIWHNLDVAVKCVRPDLFGGNTEEAIAAFCQEVEIQSRLRHPYILRMFGACLSPPHRAWIITEYLPSGRLTEWLHGTKNREKNRIVPLPPLSERLRIAMEISMGMEFAHKGSPKILHRDLKPSNILLDENKHVRIADFNSARYFTDKDVILTGETGTYLYMAPEVMAHECYDQMCDVYSFAVLLCELVTGIPPYADSNYSPAEIACKVALGTLRPTLPENQPAPLMQLIQRAWEQDPRKRPSFSELTITLNIIAKDCIHA